MIERYKLVFNMHESCRNTVNKLMSFIHSSIYSALLRKTCKSYVKPLLKQWSLSPGMFHNCTYDYATGYHGQTRVMVQMNYIDVTTGYFGLKLFFE